VTLAVNAALLGLWEIVRENLGEAWQIAPAWLDTGGFIGATEEALGLPASGWAGWGPMPELFRAILANLPDQAAPKNLNLLLARLYRHQAFEAHLRKTPRLTRKAAERYLRYRPLSALQDRGLISIWLRSWWMASHA
jgi:hypothetical protein